MNFKIWALLFFLILSNAGPATSFAQEAVQTNAHSVQTVPLTNHAVAHDVSEKVQEALGFRNVPLLQQTFLGNKIGEYLIFLGFVLLAMVLAKIIDFVLTNFLSRITQKTRSELDDQIVRLLHGPIKVVVFVIVIVHGLKIFENTPAWLNKTIHHGLSIIVAISITFCLVRLVDLFDTFLRPKITSLDNRVDEQLLGILRKTLKVFVVIIAVLVTAQNNGINVTSVLAGLGIGGLAVALAAQDTLANIFGSIVIFADKVFRVGERVVINGYDGTIESIGLRSTRIRLLEGTLVTIPNKTIANADITNVSKRPSIRTIFTVGLVYHTTPEKIQLALDILRKLYQEETNTEKSLIYFRTFADYSLNIDVVHWWKGTDWEAYLKGMERINLEILKRFNAEGLEFAFPTQTHHVSTFLHGNMEAAIHEDNPQASAARTAAAVVTNPVPGPNPGQNQKT